MRKFLLGALVAVGVTAISSAKAAPVTAKKRRGGG